MYLPRMTPIRQRLRNPPLRDLPTSVRGEMDSILREGHFKSNSTVAITAGSRGISHLAETLRSIIEELKSRETQPFIVAAMGSHGGPTAEGKLRILAQAGVTESSVGAPVLSTPQVTRVGATPTGIPLFVNAEAAGADHILLVNRVHPHSSFEGQIQSGLMKMLCVGLGNQPGAEIAHRQGVQDGLGETILAMGRRCLEILPVIGGLGILENESNETALVRGFPARHLERGEKSLLQKSQSMRLRIPFRSLHLVIVDRIGKEISGTGMDPKVIRRQTPGGETAPVESRFFRIYARSLTPASRGNGHGVGLADFVSRRLADAIDWEVTRANSLAASVPEKSRLPVVMDTDREAIEAALQTCGPIGDSGPKVVRITDTRSLQKMWISEALLEEAAQLSYLETLGGPCPLEFDRSGFLV